MANLVTIIRSLLVFVVIIMLSVGKESAIVYFIGFVLTILVVSMDGLDGYLARKYHTESKFGALLDIVGDRIVENVYWISFLAFGWIQLWIPIVVVARGIIVDGIRSIAMEQGYTAFGKTTMQKSSLGKFLVASNFSRGSYAAFKGIAFSTLILLNMRGLQPEILKTIVFYLTYISVYIAVFFCVIRGLPVMIEGKELFKEKEPSGIDKTDPEQQNNSSSNSVPKEVTSIR